MRLFFLTCFSNLLAYITWGLDTVVYDYDDNANTVSTNDRTYVYDSSNQLIEVWDGANQIAGYTYNGAGQRIEKLTQSETRIFHYDLRGHLIAETDEYGEMIAEYIYLGDQLLAMITKPSETEIVSYFHNDHLGTPLILTNDNETIVWKAAYTPFGGADISVQTVENPFRLPGQYYDQETGLHYNYFRYYNPQTGRYMTPDPIGLEGGINLFVYVENQPVNWIDPWGLHGPGYIPPGSHPCISTGTCHYGNQNPDKSVDSCGETESNCYDECLSGFGISLLISDTVGLWGFGSMLATGGISAILKAGIEGSEAVAKNSLDIFGGRGFTYLKGYDKYMKYMGAATRLGWLAKISGYVTVGATVYSAGVRLYCWDRCR